MIPTPEEALLVQHQDWLKHPVTKQMLHLLDVQKETWVKGISMTAATAEDVQLRKLAVGLNSIDTLKQWITNSNSFVELSNKHK